MSKQFKVMPDYLAALEWELRTRAGSTASTVAMRRRRQAPRRLLAIAVVLAGLAVLPALLLAGSTGSGTRAYGRPVILATPSMAIPLPLKNGLTMKLALGDAADALTEARPIHAYHNAAYLLSGRGAWCLSVPDPGAREPLVERIVTCTDTHELLHIGISLVAGDQYVAAIPDGVMRPVLRRADGTREELRPDEQGVVKVDHFEHGDAVTLYGTNGERSTDHAR